MVDAWGMLDTLTDVRQVRTLGRGQISKANMKGTMAGAELPMRTQSCGKQSRAVHLRLVVFTILHPSWAAQHQLQSPLCQLREEEELPLLPNAMRAKLWLSCTVWPATHVSEVVALGGGVTVATAMILAQEDILLVCACMHVKDREMREGKEENSLFSFSSLSSPLVQWQMRAALSANVA
ncbi:hypothetical protein E2320_003772 [Naja naja]|nr:hypothetical protein E2320_003772 [Naja naja]